MARPSADRKECPLYQSLSLPKRGGISLLLNVPATLSSSSHMEGEPGKSQYQSWTNTEKAHCSLCTLPLSKDPDGGGLPRPKPEAKGPKSSPTTAPCHWCVSLATVPQAAHPLLQKAAGGPCPVPALALAFFFLLPQSYVTGLTLGDMNSHLVIPGTLWHVDRGADTGREEAGRTGNRSLLTASSWAAWRGSRCCLDVMQGHRVG